MGGIGSGYMNFIDPLGIMHSNKAAEAPAAPTITTPTAALPVGQESGTTSELLNTKGGASGTLLNPAKTSRQSVLGS